MIPKHYSLKAENPQSYEIHDARDGKTFHIAKNGLDLAMHGKLSGIQKFDDGGTVQGQTLGSRIGYPGSPKTPPKAYAEGGVTGSEFSDPRGNPVATPDNPLGTDVQPQSPMPDSNPYATPASSPDQLPGVPASAEIGAAAPPSPPPSPPPGSPPAPIGAPLSALNEAEGAIRAGAKAEAGAANKSAVEWDLYSQELAKRPSVQQLVQAKKDQNDKLASEIISGKIDPDRWWKNQGTAGAITAGIGMILGGIGAAQAGGPNYAMEAINKAIDRDIDSQKADKANKMSLWHMNRSAMQDDINAELTTRNQMLTGVQAKMQKFASEAGGPQALAKVAPAILQIQQQKQMNSWMSAHLSGGTPGSEAQHIQELKVMQIAKPELYKDMEAKYIPGVGVARVPLAEKDRDAFKHYANLENSINEAIDFQKNEAGSLGTFPGSAANAKATSIRNRLIAEFNQLVNLNRLNGHEFDLFKESMPHPGSFRSASALAQFEQFKKAVLSQRQTEMIQAGVVPFQKAPQDQQAMAWANANPNDPRSQKIKSMLGGH